MVNIKEANYFAIKEFALFANYSRINGTKLHALYRLIQKKGEPIKSNDKNLAGVKCLEFDKGEYVAIIHTPFKKGCFFPCKLRQIHLQRL